MEQDNTKPNLDNHSNQLNPHADAYWQSRGYEARPANWEQLISSAADPKK